MAPQQSRPPAPLLPLPATSQRPSSQPASAPTGTRRAPLHASTGASSRSTSSAPPPTTTSQLPPASHLQAPIIGTGISRTHPHLLATRTSRPALRTPPYTGNSPARQPSPSPNPSEAPAPGGSGEQYTSRWRLRLARLRAAMANPEPEDQGLYDSITAPAAGQDGQTWHADADDAAFLAALTHNGVGAALSNDIDYPQDGDGIPGGRYGAKVYRTSTDTVDEIVVDFPRQPRTATGTASGGEGSRSPQQGGGEKSVGVVGGGGVPRLMAEGEFYPPRRPSPGPRKPPDKLRAVVWWVLAMGGLWGWIGRRVWPGIVRFFDLGFWSPTHEELYRRDSWFTNKQLAFTASLFYILNTILAISLIPRPLNLYNKITYFGVAPVLTVPVVVMVLFNAPRFRWSHRMQLIYQPLLLLATWCWSWFSIWDMWACGYYSVPGHPLCGNKDFLSLFYFSTALPVLALFTLGQHRAFAALGATTYLVIMCVLILPERVSWVRNVVNFVLFQSFLIYVHYMRETAERRIFILREQLKAQFKVTEKAQDMERRASDSKKRFVSYIFHEVRVPLNTALLAVQNLAPDVHAWRGEDDIEFGALEGSLNMMSKVLNDVLDFNRMDSGRFESIHSPFCFHNVIRTMLIPLGLGAQARGISVTTELDRRIDEAANRASGVVRFRRGGGNGNGVGGGEAEDEGWVLGDEMRLRQLVTNLTSNACKFTGPGGRIWVRTSLIKDWMGCDGEAGEGRCSEESGGPWLWKGRPAGRDSIVVRIEVEDTGVGIRPKDILANQLFSPYVQTEIGRYQGGKGTGLGLALVRHIVKLSGGRLGLRSKVGRGSTFWVELALGVGKEAAPPALLSGETVHSESMNGWPGEVAGGRKEVRSPDGEGMRFGKERMGAGTIGDASSVEGVTPGSNYTNGSAGLLDSPMSEDPALRTIMEHGGMVELTSRRSPVYLRSGEPSPGANSDLNSPLLLPASLAKPSRTTDPPDDGIPMQPLTPRTGSKRSPADDSTSTLMPSAPTPVEEPLPVLVVDDDLLTRRLMARMLSRLGCAADVAEDGQAALNMLLGPNTASRALKADPTYAGAALPTPPLDADGEDEFVDEYKYGVVFLDNQMPFYSGVQVVYKLRELGRDTFVVGVTGNALQEDQQEYHDAGVDHILTKPVLEKDLRAMVVLARDVRKKKLAVAGRLQQPSNSSTLTIRS